MKNKIFKLFFYKNINLLIKKQFINKLNEFKKKIMNLQINLISSLQGLRILIKGPLFKGKRKKKI